VGGETGNGRWSQIRNNLMSGQGVRAIELAVGSSCRIWNIVMIIRGVVMIIKMLSIRKSRDNSVRQFRAEMMRA